MWLHIPTSLFSPALECSTSDFTSLYQALAASVTVSGKARQPRYWRLAWQKANWTKRLSTPTCDPSLSNRIVAAWLESLAVSPAKTSALPAERQASTATGAGYSLKSSDLFASWNQLSGCFSKTSPQSSLFPQELPYSENLPRSGSMRNGQLYERQTVVHRTDAIERSYWPTADANTSTYSNGKRGENLRESAANWPTPRGTDGAKGGPNQAGSRGDLMLPSAAAMWSTPRTSDTNGAGSHGVGGMDLRPQVQQQWNAESARPTPKARDWKSAEGSASMNRNDPDLAAIATRFSHPDQPTPQPGPQSSQSDRTSRRLSPVFVEWLMAVPRGWTDFAPLGTEWFRYRQQLRSAYSRIVLEFSEVNNA